MVLAIILICVIHALETYVRDLGGVPVVDAYGMTEAAHQIASSVARAISRSIRQQPSSRL